MKLAFFPILTALSLYGADAPNPMPQMPHPAAPLPLAETKTAIGSMSNAAKSYYPIDPQNRSADLIQAYDLLKKEKPTLKISMRTSNGSVLTNVMDMTAASKGTLLFVKVQSNLGPKTVVVSVEEAAELYYSP